MKFGQALKYNVRDTFTQKSCRKRDRETSSKSLFFKKKRKALYKVKANDQHLSFNIFWKSWTWSYNKNN